MNETTITGTMTPKLVDEVQRVAQRFMDKQVKIVIQEFNGEEKSWRRKD
jgi:hypothetical protein